MTPEQVVAASGGTAKLLPEKRRLCHALREKEMGWA